MFACSLNEFIRLCRLFSLFLVSKACLLFFAFWAAAWKSTPFLTKAPFWLNCHGTSQNSRGLHSFILLIMRSHHKESPPSSSRPSLSSPPQAGIRRPPGKSKHQMTPQPGPAENRKSHKATTRENYNTIADRAHTGPIQGPHRGQNDNRARKPGPIGKSLKDGFFIRRAKGAAGLRSHP